MYVKNNKNLILQIKTFSHIYINQFDQTNQIYLWYTHLYRGTVNEPEK